MYKLSFILVFGFMSVVAQTSNNNFNYNTSTGNDSLIDIFPLTKNLYYCYTYNTQDTIYWVSILETISETSGTVEYIVIDSTQTNDTLCEWSVKQIRSLRTITLDCYSGRKDTSWISDSLSLTLFEILFEKHRIVISSAVWSNQYIEYYRYASTNSILQSYGNGVWGVQDSVWLSSELGLYKRKGRSYFSTNHRYYSYWEMNLQSTPVVSVNHRNNKIKGYELNQNYPNPFNPTTTIAFNLFECSDVTLTIYDLLGRDVVTLINKERMTAGSYSKKWNANNMPSGIYFYRLQTDKFTETKKLVLLK